MSAVIIRQLDEIEHEAGGDGELTIGRTRLRVTSLDKVFFPKKKYTKGDLMRYYVDVSKALLPVIKDRPLVLKRYPNGVTGGGFFQQKAPDDAPPGVRVETIVNDQGEQQRRLVGDGLITLLYTVQIGSVSVDPWHSRVQSLDYADYSFIDLDPGPRAGFKRVIAVARWV
jgi:bifunctional non-homologous end joining protein LigD